MRYILIVAEDRMVHEVFSYGDLDEAKKIADMVCKRLNPNTDDVVVWDLQEKRMVFSPFRG